MISDEGGYTYVATFWTNTYRLYRDIPFDRPPAIFLVYRGILWAFGSHVEAIRLAAALWNAATTLAIFGFALETSKSRLTAAGAALMFSIVSASPSIEGFTANAELFAVLPLVLSAHLTWMRQWFWAGLLAGVAAVIKAIGVSGLLLTTTWVLVTGGGARALMATATGFALAPALSAVHISTIDWNAFWAQQQQRVLANSVVTNGWSSQFVVFLSSAVKTSPAWLGLASLALLGWQVADANVRWFGSLWALFSLLGMSIGGAWSWHYWSQLVPPLVWMSVPATGFPKLRWNALPALLCCALGSALFLTRELPLWFAKPAEISWSVYQRPGYLIEDD